MESQLTKTAEKPKGVKRQNLRKWILRLALCLVVLAVLCFVFAAIGYKLGLIDLKTSFGMLNRDLGPKLMLASLAAGVVSLCLAFFIKPRKGFAIAALAILIPLISLGKLKSVQKTAAKLPFIHDVSTDTQNPPMFTEAVLTRRGDNSNPVNYVGKKDPRGTELVSVLQTQAYPDIRSVIMSDTPQVVFGKAKAVIRQMGWEVLSEDVETGLIEAVDTTFWYGFKDDIIIRIKPSEGGGTVVDIRSLSRVGGSDLGKNAARIRDFVSRLKAT